ncbi:MAG: sulfate adenylyltransferase subunit CysD [Planctomycetota bacterium]
MNDYSYLDNLENKSIYIIREAYYQYRDRLAVLWSIGKDSTSMVHLIRKAFFGQVPIPVIHLDTSYKFKEIYQFREHYARQWGLKLLVARNEEALKQGMAPEKGRLECCTALKTETLKQVIKKYNLKALLLAIRRDEHAIRAKERYFSPRDANFQWDYQNQPPELWEQYNRPASREADAGRPNQSGVGTSPVFSGERAGQDQTNGAEEVHFRIHPMLGWREIDIWRYIKRENLPVVELYFSKNGQRYRSIGCETCCQPVPSDAETIDDIIKELETTKTAERSGRAQDKEQAYMMQKLRSLGYM